jgi:hypothetical protein
VMWRGFHGKLESLEPLWNRSGTADNRPLKSEQMSRKGIAGHGHACRPDEGRANS